MSDLREKILEHVNAANYQPVKPAVIAKKLGLTGDEAHEVKKTVKRLVKEKQIAYGPSHLVFAAGKSPAQKAVAKKAAEKAAGKAAFQAALKKSTGDDENIVAPINQGIQIAKEPTKKLKAVREARLEKDKRTHPPNHVTGTFRRAAAGFGFVRPEGTARADGRDSDVFIPMDKTGDASSGDVVSVKLEQRGRMGKLEGRIIDVIERATSRFVGVYFEQAGMGMVQIDGKLFQKPIFVGDPGAKGARVDDKVVVDMVRFPSHTRDGEGVIVDILGQRGEPGVDTMSIIHEFNLPGEFDDAALDDAREQAAKFDESIPKGRRDLTEETIITIDPVDARDFDDAISLEKNKQGHWVLGVHIADVSHFVRAKSPLDREAHDRATSVYLPDRVIPMLPEIISNNLASLQPDKVRYALTALIEMTPEGHRRGDRRFQERDQEPAAVHLRRSRRIPGQSGRVEKEARARGPLAVGADARAGDALAEAAIRSRFARAFDAGTEDRPRRRRPRHRRPSGEEHREPSDHRRVHARRERSGRPEARRRGAALPPPRARQSRPAQAKDAHRVCPRARLRRRES